MADVIDPTYAKDDLIARWTRMKGEFSERRIKNADVSAARRGAFDEVMPGVFPTNWPKPVVANIIDTSARDLAELLARLPAIDCQSSQSTTNVSKKSDAKRTKVALSYIEHSRVKKQLYTGCDWYTTFAAMPIIVEPDYDAHMPRIRIDDPRDSYWQLDFYGNTYVYAHAWTDSVASLCAKFPEFEAFINNDPNKNSIWMDERPDTSQIQLEVVQMYWQNHITLFLPERNGLILSDVTHKFPRPPVVIAERPKWDNANRGQFDDVIWVWLAKARMAVYGLEAADKAVRAPLAVPDDVQNISFGADAIIRTNDPDKVRRVALDLPQAAMIEPQILDQEVADGTRTPAARRGDINASVVTGRGVEALTSIYQTQIATAQDIIGDALRRVLMMCFEMDELYWANVTKTVNGMASGAPFTETYTPAKDIKGNHTISVTYGMTAGMDPNRAIVFLLQLRADQSIDRDTMQRMLPFDVDVDDLQRRIDVEQIEDAMKQGLFALLANAPMMGAQGMDPLETLRRAAQIVTAREKGVPIHQAMVDAFQPAPQAAGPQNPMDQLAQALGGGGGGGDQAQVTPGDPTSVNGAGSAPDVMTLLAGLTRGGNNPNLNATVSKRLGTGV